MSNYEVAESFSAALHDALGMPNDHESISRIKELASVELRRLDPRASVLPTAYFNHSYVPDFVLKWSSGAVSERQVFLRFAQPGPTIERDLSRIGAGEPAVLTLQPLHLSAAEQADVDTASLASGSLVIDQAALEPVIEAVEAGDAFVGLYASAVARSGRGLQSGERARETLDSVANSYKASIEGQTSETIAGVRRLDDALKPSASGPMRQLLEAVWSGDDAFPETVDAVAQLSDESVLWLLELGERADADLWRRVSRKTDLAQLERVAPLSYSSSFQQLVAASLDHLHAKAAMVSDRSPRATDDGVTDHAVHWGREGDVLALDIGDYRILVGSTIDKIRRRAQHDDHLLPTIGQLASRTLALAVPKLKVNGEELDLEAVVKERGATETRTDLQRAADYLPAASAVSSLEVAVPAGGRLNVDFRRRLATSVAASNPYLSELTRVAALLLCDATDEFRELLSHSLPVHSSPNPGQGEFSFEA